MRITQAVFTALVLGLASLAQGANDSPQLMLDTGGHTSVINGLAFTSDGKQIISAGDDKVIRIWDWRAGKTVRTIRGQVGPGNEGKIHAIALSRDGRWLVVGGVMAPFRGARPDEVGTIRVYDFVTGEMKKVLRGHANTVLGLDISPDSKRLASGSSDESAIIWDLETGSILHQVTGHEDGIHGVAFNRDGTRFATASYDGKLKVWSSDGRALSTLEGHTRSVMGVAFSPTNQMIVSTSWDNTVKFWNGDTGQSLRSMDMDCGWNLSFTPDGRLIVCAMGLVIDVSAETGSEKDRPSVGRVAAVSPDSRWAATVDGNGAIRVWDVETGREEIVLGGTGQNIWALGFSSDGCDLAWGNTALRQKENDRGDLVQEIGLPCVGKTISAPRKLSRPAGEYTEPVTSHGDDELVLASRITGPAASANMNLLHVKQGSTLIATLDARMYGFRHQVYTFTPDGKTVLSGGANGYLTAYDIPSTKVREFVGHVGYVYAIAVSPDGRLAASGATDKTINLWNASTGELIATFFYGRDGEWVMWTPQGYYASSPAGDRIVGWQINKGPEQAAEYVTANQLRTHFYRPDIIDQAIVLASATAAIAQARGTEFSLADLLKRVPPAFDILSPTDRSRASATPTEIRLIIEPNSDPVEALEVLVNGRQVTTSAMLNATARLAPSESLDRRIEVPLEQGENKIRIVARNQIGQTMRDFVLFHNKPGQLDRHGTLYVLAIGVDNYPGLPPICGANRNQTCNLQYAGTDARAFRDVLVKQAMPLYKEIKTLLLARDGDKPPTKANIEDALGEMLAKAGPEDTTALFIAGHGVNDDNGADYLFLPEDAELSRDGGWRRSTVLPWILFLNALRKTQGQRVMFADTCRSGNAYNARLLNDSADANIIVFAATDATTVSSEYENLNHGAFTYALIQGLEGKARRKDGSVRVLGLGEFISVEVAELTNGKQQPTFYMSGGKNFMLASLEAVDLELITREAAEREATARAVSAQEAATDPRVVDMLFATSRKAAVSASNVTFTRERAVDLSFGSLRVRIPETHKIGRIELPETRDFILFKYEQALDEKRHFVMRDITLLNRDTFIQKLKSGNRSEALVFVHGFNNTFEEAAFRMAQMVFDMDYKGLPVLFSWAAASGVHGYRYDIDSARLARNLLVQLLQILQQDSGIRTVHIIAHSMGNAVVMEALDRIAGERMPIKVDELIMAAPDVSRDLFMQLIENVNKVTKGMTLYASSKDKALVASKALALDVPRAGDVPAGGPIVLPRVDTIDVSAFGEEFLGLNHNTFASNRSLIDDIGRLIRSGQRPPGIRTPQLKGRPAAVNPPRYWLYPE